MDHINVFQVGNDKIAGIIERNADAIKEKVLAGNIIIGELQSVVKEWNINGEVVEFGVEKIK